MIYYLTTKRFPASTADHIYIENLAKGFAQIEPSFRLVTDTRSIISPNISIDKFRFDRPKQFFVALWLLTKTLVRRKHQLTIISNDIKALYICIRLRQIGLKFKIVLDCHMLTNSKIDAVVLAGSDLVITTSKRLKKIILDRHPNVLSSKIHPVYGAVDSIEIREENETFTDRTKLGIPDSLHLIGYVGGFNSLGHKKGLETILKALPLLGENYGCLLVGGTSHEVEELRKLSIQIGVSKHSFILEKVPHNEVRRYLLLADILVIPYPDEPHFRDFGFPMKAYEYLATNKPIVYSDLEILDEVLSSHGTSFASGDAESLVNSIRVAPVSREPVVITWQEKAEKINNLISKI